MQLRVLLKFAAFTFVAVSYLALGGCIALMMRDHNRRRAVYLSLISHYARIMRIIFGLRVVRDYRDMRDAKYGKGPYFLVANHLGYLDIIALLSLRKVIFVTSVEMQKTPFLGWLCEIGGCFFVERRDRSKTMQEVAGLSRLMQQGYSVAVFPEATSTNGEQVLPFKRSMFKAAVMAQVPVIPICINYDAIDQEPLTWHNRDRIFWYGRMKFLPHLLQVFALRTIDVRLTVGPTLVTQHDHRDAAFNSWQFITGVHEPINRNSETAIESKGARGEFCSGWPQESPVL